LALDRPGMLDAAYHRHDFEPGDSLTIGPFEARTWLLPHSKPNAGVRLEAEAGVRRLVLAHVMPETDVMAALQAASAGFVGPIEVASIGLEVTVDAAAR